MRCWDDHAVIISKKKYGEKKWIFMVFSRQYGLYRGLVGSQDGKTMTMGAVVHASWRAKSSGQLGSFSFDVIQSVLVALLPSSASMYSLHMIHALISKILPVHHPYPGIFDTYLRYVRGIYGAQWWVGHMAMEFDILTHGGFGFDWSCCALSGVKDGLTHISPKTGRSVCRAVADQYPNRLLAIPRLLKQLHDLPYSAWPEDSLGQNHDTPQQILESFTVMDHFFLLHFPYLKPTIDAIRPLLRQCVLNESSPSPCPSVHDIP
jgi:DNA repair protein RecO (recombination protein O)